MSDETIGVETIGVIGGTGKLGEALARRWLKAGLKVNIGSRDADKASATVRQLNEELGVNAGAGSNREIAANSDLIVVTVPFSAQEATLSDIKDEVQGKIVVDTTVPLMPPKVMRVQMPPEGCAAMKAQQLLGDNVRMVSAFHSVAAHRLATTDNIRCDVMVFGDDKTARNNVVQLANAAGLRGIHAGALVNSVAAEALTSILIFVNKTYQVDGAGIEFTGELIMP